MTNVIQRYTWEDALIEAERVGILTAGAVNTGLRLARVINWVPGDGRPSGLYWANELAAEVVSVSRATLFRRIKELKEAGYLLEEKGNLLPVLSESHNETFMRFAELQQSSIDAYNDRKSQSDTASLKVRLTKSQDETGQSQSDNPYSEDTYTEDLYSEDSLSEDAAVDISLPSISSNKESDSFSNQELTSNWEVEDVPQSQNETMGFWDYQRTEQARAAREAYQNEW